jgi:hypothetical protein
VREEDRGVAAAEDGGPGGGELRVHLGQEPVAQEVERAHGRVLRRGVGEEGERAGLRLSE